MSTTETTRPTRPADHSTDRPTATFPTGQWLAGQAAHRERLADLWEDATPTERLPVIGPRPAAGLPLPAAGRTAPRTAFPAVDDEAAGRPTAHRRPAARRERLARAERRREARRRHLKAVLTAIALAAAILTGLQLYAANGITAARQAALQSARTGAPAHAYSTPSSDASSADPRTEGAQQPRMSGHTADVRSGIQPEWVTQDSGAPYSATDPSASPLDLPACTTSPTTPMPCLAWNSADSRRAVVLEEDGSLTGLVRQ